MLHAGTSFLGAMAAPGALLQSSYHVQVLAMSGNLASPGISGSYRTIAKQLRW